MTFPLNDQSPSLHLLNGSGGIPGNVFKISRVDAQIAESIMGHWLKGNPRRTDMVELVIRKCWTPLIR